MEKVDTFEAHISAAVLRGWVQDELDEKLNKSVEEHLESCESCAQCLESILQENGTVDRRELKGLLDNIKPPQPSDRSASPCYLQTGQEIGPYTLVRRIGSGGMGEVWLADQREPIKRKVAIKLIKAGLDSSHMLERFNLERRSLARLDHPQIAKILDAGSTEQGQPFFTMQWCPGEPIDEYCKRHSLSAQVRIEMIAQVCDAIQHAHHKGVIHRDLKPSNILVAEEDGKPVVKVIDFGIAKLTMIDDFNNENGNATIAGQVLGTPCYMSPEQSSNGELDVDSRTDIYSLGIILYELLTGELPTNKQKPTRTPHLAEILRFRFKSTASRTGSIFSNAAIWKETGKNFYSGTLNHDVEIIASKARAKDRELRYSTPAALAADLRRYLRFEPIEARPPSGIYHVKRFCQRHLASVSIAAFAAIGLITTTALSIDFAISADQANRRSAIRLQEAIETREKANQLRRSAELASREANETSYDSQYLTDLYANALILNGIQNPRRASSPKEFLDVFAKKINLELSRQPERRLKLLGTVAEHYESIGESESARLIYQERLDLLQEELTPEPEELLLEELRIFFCLVDLNRKNEARLVLTKIQEQLGAAQDRELSKELSSAFDLALILCDESLQGVELIDRLDQGYLETHNYAPRYAEISTRYANAICDAVFESGLEERMYLVDGIIESQLTSFRTSPNFKLFKNIQNLIEYAHYSGNNDLKKRYRITHDLAVKVFSGEISADVARKSLADLKPSPAQAKVIARAYEQAKRVQ